jgi:hypothetical protein
MAIQDNSYEYLFEDSPTGGRSAMEQREDLANMLAEKQNPDSEVVTALAKQILASSNTSKWSGAGHGSAEANARDMARIMAGIGITDIKQFGPITQEVQEIIGNDDGGNPIYDTQTQKTFGNKETGQAVPLTYSGRQTGDFFGGTYAGKGNTGYGVRFDDQGNPFFYTQGASSNTLANLMQDMGPVFQIGLALATGGLSIPQQIAARMAVNVLSGQDMSDAVKSAAISMAVANIPGTDFMKDGAKYIKEMGLDPTITKTLTNSFQNAVTSGATAALRGQDISDAMLRGAATGGVNGAINALLNSADMTELTKDLSATQKRLVANAVTGVISGKPLDQVLINSAIAAASAEAKIHKPLSTKEYDELDDDEKKVYNEKGTKELYAYQQNIKNLNSLTTSGRTGGDMGGNDDPTNTSTNPAELVIAAQRRADEEAAAALLAEQERLAREAQQAADRARDEANRRTAEAKNLKDAEDARKAREEADRLAREVKENEIRITAKRKADEEAAARLAEQEELARKAQQAAIAPKSTPVPPENVVNITTRKAVPECPPGFVYDQDLKMCTPVEGTGTPPIDLPSKGKIEIVGKKDTCPIGTKLNLVTGECDPFWDEGGGDDPTTKPTTPATPSTPSTPPPTAVKPPAATTTKPTVTTPQVPASFVPSSGGAAMPAETTDPIYAGKMGDFNLFATLQEILANESGENASTKPNVKTKMATGGHLDDLLAEQMTVDDLLNLLR